MSFCLSSKGGQHVGKHSSVLFCECTQCTVASSNNSIAQFSRHGTKFYRQSWRKRLWGPTFLSENVFCYYFNCFSKFHYIVVPFFSAVKCWVVYDLFTSSSLSSVTKSRSRSRSRNRSRNGGRTLQTQQNPPEDYIVLHDINKVNITLYKTTEHYRTLSNPT